MTWLSVTAQRSAALGLLLLLAHASAANAAPDLAQLLDACQACHGREGISETAGFPNLAAQKNDYLVRQLEAFKNGERKNDLMAAVAAQLSAADIRALAQHWSRLPGTARASSTSTAIRSRLVFPADFPKGFVLYERRDDPAAGTAVLRYANAPAHSAARAGQPLRAGAVIIVANHALQLDAARRPLRDAAGVPLVGKATSYAGMAIGAGWGETVPPLLRNGDWDYALFDAERTRRETVNQAPCLACHKPLAADSHVFTLKALRETTGAALAN